MKHFSSWPQIVGAVALLTAIAGGIAGLASFALYEIEVITLIAIPIGPAAARWSSRRGDDPTLSQAAFILGFGTLGAWLVVLLYALGIDSP